MRNCKEYLERQEDGTYALVLRGDLCKESDILVPEGAEIAIQFKNDPDYHGVVFYKNGGKSSFSQKDKSWQNDSNWTMQDLLDVNHCEDGIDLSHDIVWQRATHPEELPFIDDEPKYTDDEVRYMDENGQGRLQSINDQYAEIEHVRQALKDNVNHPSHYTQGKIECIDAIEAGMSEEMFEGYLKGCCNKYLWRYKMKGGSESLRKAQWYLDRLIKLNEKIESRN